MFLFLAMQRAGLKSSPTRWQVVIGVFCNTAIENAHADKELASIKQVYTKTNQAQ